MAALAGAADVQARTWSDPDSLTAPGPPAGGFQLAFDRHGRGLAAWQATGPGHATVLSRPSGRGWSSVRRLPDLSDARFVLSADGRTTVVGSRPGRSRFEGEPVFGTGWLGNLAGPMRALDRRPAAGIELGAPVIAGNDRGDAIVVWNREGPDPDGEGCRDCDDLVARVSRRGRPFGPRLLVARRQSLWDLRVAMNARGDAVVAWSDVDYGGGAVRTRVVSASNRWKRVETVPGADSYIGDSATDLAADIGPRGRVLVAWASTWEPSDIASDAHPNSVYVAVRSQGGRFGRPVKLAEDAAKMGEHAVGHLDATITTRGDGLVAWTEQEGTNEIPRVRAAVVGAGAGAITTRTLDADRRGAEVADVAPGPRNDAVILWTTRSRYAEGFEPTLLRATHFRAGTYGPVHSVSPPGDRASVYSAVAAIDPVSRRATALWLRFGGRDGNGSRVLTSSRAIR